MEVDERPRPDGTEALSRNIWGMNATGCMAAAAAIGFDIWADQEGAQHTAVWSSADIPIQRGAQPFDEHVDAIRAALVGAAVHADRFRHVAPGVDCVCIGPA